MTTDWMPSFPAAGDRLADDRARPVRLLAAAAVASLAAALLGSVRGWPVWALALAAVLPWLPAFAADAAWFARRSGSMALLYVLAVSQGGHLLEHVAQMVQIHLLGLSGPDARGIVGQLDVEWVHFAWNTWVVVAAAILVARFPRNPWLVVLVVAAAWHELEHAYLMAVYLSTGAAGTPGLLASGGAVAGGLPLARPDLHFLYNLVETLPLFVAFGVEVRRASDRRGIAATPDGRGIPDGRRPSAPDVLGSAGQSPIAVAVPAERP